MTGGRDLLHEDMYVRRGSIDYVKDTISQISEWGGEIITIVPSTVGKVGRWAPPDEWKWAVESLKECQAHAEEKGVRIGLEPLNRFETYFINRHDQAPAPRRGRGRQLRRLSRHLPQNIEEADWAEAIRTVGDKLVDFTWPTTTACRAARARSTGKS